MRYLITPGGSHDMFGWSVAISGPPTISLRDVNGRPFSPAGYGGSNVNERL